MKTLCTLLLLLCVNFTIQAQYNNIPIGENLKNLKTENDKRIEYLDRPKVKKHSIIEIPEGIKNFRRKNDQQVEYLRRKAQNTNRFPQHKSPKRNESNIWKNPFFKFLLMLGSILLFRKDSILYKEKEELENENF